MLHIETQDVSHPAYNKIFKVMAVSQSDAPTDGSAFASVLVSDQMFTIPGLGVVGTFAALGSAGVVAPFRRYLRNR